jgi:PAS domain S-box-containing protein
MIVKHSSFLEVNEAAQERYGYSRAEFLRMCLTEVHAPEEIGRFQQEVRQSKPGIKDIGEWRHLCRNGDPIDVEVRVRNIRFGGVDCRLEICRDVTERKRAEERLRLSEDRYRHAIDQSDAVLYQLDYTSQRYVFISDRIETLTGYRPEEITAALWRQMIRETRMRGEATGLLAVDAAVRAHSDELKVWRADYRIRTRAGETRWLSDSSIQLHDKDGKVHGALGILQDITDREQTMRALHESEERLRAMTQFSSDIITILEADGTIRSQTGGIEALLGYSEREAVGRSVLSYVHEDDWGTIQQSLEHLITGVAPVVTATFRIRHGDGSWRWVESIANSQLQNPAIAGVVVNSRDVTDRVRFQEQIVQSQKLASLGELVAGVAHEINNPLAAISGHAQLLQMHSDMQVRVDATAIRDMAQRASRITNSLRSYARPSSDTTTSRSQPGDLRQVIQSSLDVIAHKLRSTEVALTIDDTE